MTVDDMPFGFIPERGTIDAVFILRRLQEAMQRKKSYMFCGTRESY